MDTLVSDKPNLAPEVVPVQNLSTGLEAIAQKMAAMRNPLQATEPTETGSTKLANKAAPVAPEGVEVLDDNSDSVLEPEVAAVYYEC